MIIERQGAHVLTFGLPVQGRATAGFDGIDANAERVVCAESPSQVQVRTQVRVRGEAGGQARQRRGARALGHQVDRGPDRALRRHAIQQRARALEDFHAFEEFRRDAVVRHQSEQAVPGEVFAAQVETAHVEILRGPRFRGYLPYGRIRKQYLRHRIGLPVLDHPRRIAGGAEGRGHCVLVAQYANASTAGNLATGIGFRQICLHGIRFRCHTHRRQSRRGVRRCGSTQRVGSIGPAHRLESLPLQQSGEALFDRRFAGQPGAVPASRQGAWRGQQYPGFLCVAVQRGVERAGGNVIAARRYVGGLRLCPACGPCGGEYRARHGQAQGPAQRTRHGIREARGSRGV